MLQFHHRTFFVLDLGKSEHGVTGDMTTQELYYPIFMSQEPSPPKKNLLKERNDETLFGTDLLYTAIDLQGQLDFDIGRATSSA